MRWSSVTVFDENILKLPVFCERVCNARRYFSEIIILNDISNFLEGKTNRVFNEIAPFYDTIEILLEKLCSCVGVWELHLARAEINQIHQEFNDQHNYTGLDVYF